MGSIEPLDVVYAIKAQKRRTSPVSGQGFTDESVPLSKGSSQKGLPPNGAGFVVNATPLSATLSTITIADFLDVVKDHYADILPKNVLDRFGINQPTSAVSDSVLYSAHNSDAGKRGPEGLAGSFENYRGRVKVDNVIFNTIVRVGVADFANVFYDINLEVDTVLLHVKDASENNKKVCQPLTTV